MFNFIAKKVGRAVGVKLALSWVRASAEGRNGPKAKAVYWWLAGRKRYLGLAAALAAVTVAALGHPNWAVAVGSGAVLLVEAGLLDKAWRNDLPPAVTTAGWYRLLAQHSGDLAALLATGFYAVTHGSCIEWHFLTCQVEAAALIGTAAGLVHLGLVDSAWKSRPPGLTFRIPPAAA